MSNSKTETSAPIIYGLSLSTPAHVVDRLAEALTRYQKRIGTRWRAHDVRTQAILTLAWLEGDIPTVNWARVTGFRKVPAAR